MEQARMAEYCRVTFEFQLRKALKTVSHRVIAATSPQPNNPLRHPRLENRFDRFFVVVNHSRHTSPPLPSSKRPFSSSLQKRGHQRKLLRSERLSSFLPRSTRLFLYTASWTGTFERRQAQMRDVHIYIWRERERKRTRTLEHSTLLSLIFFDL